MTNLCETKNIEGFVGNSHLVRIVDIVDGEHALSNVMVFAGIVGDETFLCE